MRRRQMSSSAAVPSSAAGDDTPTLFPGILRTGGALARQVRSHSEVPCATLATTRACTDYPNLGHKIWDRAYKEEGLVHWFFAQCEFNTDQLIAGASTAAGYAERWHVIPSVRGANR